MRHSGASDDLQAMEQAYGFDELETSRVVEQRVRLRQHCFASQVLNQYRHRCAFCGLDASSLRGHRLLVASHVKPWAASSNRERLDPRNGVAACTIHDSAFDTGLLTIQRDLAILRAPALDHLLHSGIPGDHPSHPDTASHQPTATTADGAPSPTDTATGSASRSATAAAHLFGPGTLADRLLVPAGVNGPAPTFLDYHRREIFRA